MSGMLDRLASLFVEPPVTEPAPSALAGAEAPLVWLPPLAAAPAPPAPGAAQPSRGPGDRLGVVCARADAALAGAAAALTLIRGLDTGCAVVATWSGSDARPVRGAAPLAAARRQAAALEKRGHAAHPTGRLVWVGLPPDEQAAADAADAVLCGASPGVLVVAGARTRVMERALGGCALVVLATREGADAELLEATQAGLERLGPPVRRVVLRGTPAALALCRRGMALPAALRRPLEAALGSFGGGQA